MRGVLDWKGHPNQVWSQARILFPVVGQLVEPAVGANTTMNDTVYNACNGVWMMRSIVTRLPLPAAKRGEILRCIPWLKHPQSSQQIGCYNSIVAKSKVPQSSSRLECVGKTAKRAPTAFWIACLQRQSRCEEEPTPYIVLFKLISMFINFVLTILKLAPRGKGVRCQTT